MAETGNFGGQAFPEDAPGAVSILFNWLGALMSIALVGGLGLWGYQLAMRDVTGVPVVRALEGPMRVAPDDPGGLQAAHQGLAVNSVAAEGGVAAPADRLILAPAPVDLSAEDLPRPALADAGAVVPAPRPTEADLLALADAIADGVTPLMASRTPQVAVIPASVPGVVRSPKPMARPQLDLTAQAVATQVALFAAKPAQEVDPKTIPAGTRLVQFGAFDAPEIARSEWARIQGQFPEFLRDKSRVVQKAESNGKTFYRLRAMGFDDLSAARRFCSALLADKQACIPVIVR